MFDLVSSSLKTALVWRSCRKRKRWCLVTEGHRPHVYAYPGSAAGGPGNATNWTRNSGETERQSGPQIKRTLLRGQRGRSALQIKTNSVRAGWRVKQITLTPSYPLLVRGRKKKNLCNCCCWHEKDREKEWQQETSVDRERERLMERMGNNKLSHFLFVLWACIYDSCTHTHTHSHMPACALLQPLHTCLPCCVYSY